MSETRDTADASFVGAWDVETDDEDVVLHLPSRPAAVSQHRHGGRKGYRWARSRVRRSPDGELIFRL
jgi:hypothetical protein